MRWLWTRSVRPLAPLPPGAGDVAGDLRDLGAAALGAPDVFVGELVAIGGERDADDGDAAGLEDGCEAPEVRDHVAIAREVADGVDEVERHVDGGGLEFGFEPDHVAHEECGAAGGTELFHAGAGVVDHGGRAVEADDANAFLGGEAEVAPAAAGGLEPAHGLGLFSGREIGGRS
jgi:hypothetical protein